MDKNHKWYSVAKQWLEGAEIEYRRRIGPHATWSDWSLAEYPHWHDSPNDEYRVKDKWAKEKQAYAEGKTIQFRIRGSNQSWTDVEWHMFWDDDYEYRVKPKDLVGKTRIVFTPAGEIITTHLGYSNVKCTFDGETNQLKSVELIKE